MKKEMNKHGAEMSINLIIIILIALFILVMVYFVLNGSFGNLGNWIGGSNQANIGAISFNCNNKCLVKDPTYCTSQEDVIFERGGKKEKFTCKQLEIVPNSGVEVCGNDCSSELISCDMLKVFCTGLTDPTKCDYAWMDQAALTAAKSNIGSDKLYNIVEDSTSRVTDNQDKTKYPGKFCVKTVKN